MNVDSLIARFGEKFTVYRPTGALTYVNGNAVPSAVETVEITASVQPAGPEDVVSDPNGDRTKVRYRVYTAYNLRNIEQSPLRQADEMDIDSRRFSVESSEKWRGNHYKVIVVAVNPEEP